MPPLSRITASVSTGAITALTRDIWVWTHGRLDYDDYLSPSVEAGRILIPILDLLRCE